jgi:hypothetical protein
MFSPLRPIWSKFLTAKNTLFVAGHSYNVGRLLDGKKWWEGKKFNTPALFIIYCSCTSEKSGVQSGGSIWLSNPSVLLRHAHTVSRKVGVSSPGCEGYAYDWLLADTVLLKPPVFLRNGVGEYGRYPNAKNTHLHSAFEDIKIQLHNMKT